MTAKHDEAGAVARRPWGRPASAGVGSALAGVSLIAATALITATGPLAALPARPASLAIPLSGEGPTAGTEPDGRSIDGDVVTVAATRRRPIPPWIFGRGAEPRLVPPRAIPGRPGPGGAAGTAPGGASTKAAAPLPRARPDRADEPSGAVSSRPMPPPAPGAVTVPIAPLE